MATKRCPCGSGYALRWNGPYQETVCPALYRELPASVKQVNSSPMSTTAQRRKAVRFMLELALTIKRQRPVPAKQEELAL